MKRPYWIALAVLLAVAGVFLVLRVRSGTDQPRYRTSALERGPIEVLVSATGTINPVVQVEVGSQVSGTVQTVRADFNDHVRRGQVLCQIEPSSFRARALQGDAAVARAGAALKDAKRQQARAHELAEQEYLSQAEVDAADLALEQRDAELKQARAQLEQWRVDLENTTIRSPIDGVVIARSIDVGQTVAASLQAPKLFVIANDLTQMQVETRIDEADIGVVHAGLPVRFTVDAFPDDSFQGVVSQVRLEPETVQGVVTYATIIRTSNPAQRLKPGMTANVSVLVARHDDVLKVPNAALRFRPPASGRTGNAGAEGLRAGGEGTGAALASPAGLAGAFTGGRGAAGSGSERRGFASRDSMRRGAGGAGGARDGRGRAGGDSMARGGTGGWSGRSSMRRGAASGGPDAAARLDAGQERGRLRPGAVFVLRDGKPVRVPVRSGDTDGAFTEIESDSLRAGDVVVVGVEQSARGSNLQPPPGMGGSPFGGGGGRGRR